jgi:magnesium-transporting ATPase (P-type)
MTSASASTEQPKGKAWHSHSVEEVLAQLDSAATGLSTAEAAKRLAVNGPNELKEGKRISSLQIFLGQFKSLIIWILIAAGVISVVFRGVEDWGNGWSSCERSAADDEGRRLVCGLRVVRTGVVSDVVCRHDTDPLLRASFT